MRPSDSPALTRTLGFSDVVMIVIGTVIGSGIFTVPGAVLGQSGNSVGLAMAVWVVGGVLSLLGALTYAEMGAMHPEAGGLYVYIRDAFGRLPAFLYGWTAFFVIGSGSCATLANAFANYVGQFTELSPVGAKVVAVSMVAVVTAVNVWGTRRSAGVQNLSTGLKAAAIVVVSVLLIAKGTRAPTSGPLWPAAMNLSTLSGAGLGMIAVLWAYEGWQYATFSAGETLDAQRTFPRAITIGTAAIIGIYLLANVGYLFALGPEGVARSNRVAAEAVTATFGANAGKAIAAVILVSIFSAANGLTLTAPRVYYAMARDGVFFAKLGEVHPRFGTPAVAILASGLWAMVLAAYGSFNELLGYVVFVGWIFYALGALAIFAYRRREPDTPRPFRAPGYPLTPILFVLSALAIVGNTLVNDPKHSLIALAFVAAGVPAYLIWRVRAAPAGSRRA